MPFWEYEMYMEELNKLIKEENDKHESEMKKAGVRDALKHSNPRAIQSSIAKAQPKMPDTIKMPSLGMPLKL